MDMSNKARVLAQYSSSCSPFEDDIFQNGSHEDEIGTFLQTELIVLSQTHTVIPDNWTYLQNLSTHKNQNIFPRKSRPQRSTGVDTVPSRNNRNTKGSRLPSSFRGGSKRNGIGSKKKLAVRALIYPKGRGASEDDSMAMGDEWGTEKDPGFEDCPSEEMMHASKKKKKDRKTGIQPTCVHTEWSSNHRVGKCILGTTPRHTRPPHCRPIKSKNRCYKRETAAQFCTGDISTQETTTPAPDTDSSSEENDSEMHHTPRSVAATTAVSSPLPPPATNHQPLLSRAPNPHYSSDSDTSLMIPPLSPPQPQKSVQAPTFHPESSEYSLPTQSPSSEDDVKKEGQLPSLLPKLKNTYNFPQADDVHEKSIKVSRYKLQNPNKKAQINVIKKRSSSVPGIESLSTQFSPTKSPLPIPIHRKISQSFSTTDLSEIMRPRIPVPKPPNLAMEFHTSESDTIENWNEAETCAWVPAPPKRDDGTCIMSQDVFEHTQLNLDETERNDFSKQIRHLASIKRIKSLEHINKISGLSSDVMNESSMEDEIYGPILGKKAQRKDALKYDLSRTKSLDFDTEPEFTAFSPIQKDQPALTSIKYLPDSLQNMEQTPQHVIKLINEMAKQRNLNMEVSDVTSPENELNVLPFQMCSSANLTASNYEDSKGKKYRFILTFNPPSDGDTAPRKSSQSTLYRVKVPLWSHQDKIKVARLPEQLTMTEIKRQEAMYELYTTEISYKKSLTILVDTFRNDPRLSPTLPEHLRILTQIEYTHLFSNATTMMENCRVIARELRSRVDNSMAIESITDILLNNLDKFACFIPYCKNQYYQALKYRELMSNNPKFSDVISNLEKSKECHNLDLTSFLMSPVQRITRLPLLISNILDYTPEWHTDHQSVKSSLIKLQELAFRCDMEAQRLTSLQGLHVISESLVFPQGMRTLPIVDPKRQLVRKGVIYRVQWRMRKLMKPEIKFQKIDLILLSDIVILTVPLRKSLKSESTNYSVIDYCKRQLLTYRPICIIKKQPFPQLNRDSFYMMARWVVSRKQIPDAFALHMLENHHGREACYLLVPNDMTDATRWAQAISPPLIPRIPGEQLYHNYEAPQVQAISNYTAQIPDELSLDVGDVVSVYRKMPDGWFEGERMRDGKHGWFPSSHMVEIVNENTRSKNIRKALALRRISTLIKYSDIV